MRFCLYCYKFTRGKATFCSRCGRSGNVKLCPRLHVNPRGSEVCSTCGSRDLSIPQRKLPLFFRVLLLLIRVLFATALVSLSLAFIPYFIQQALINPNHLLPSLLLGLVLGFLWLIWIGFNELCR